MNNEIKEILDYYRNIVNDKKETYTVISKDTIYLEHLLDYITNLQQENNNLKTSLDESQEVFIELQQENKKLSKQHLATIDKLIETQQRIEKAVEYLKNNCYIGNCINTYEAIDITNVMDILNGRSDE